MIAESQWSGDANDEEDESSQDTLACDADRTQHALLFYLSYSYLLPEEDKNI